MSGGKGGSTSASVEVPEFIRAPAERNIQRAEQVQQLGYMPYMGVDVAAPTPGMQNLMQQRGRTAESLGIVGPGYDPLAGLPQQQRGVPQNVTQFDTPTTSAEQLNQIYMEELGRPVGQEGSSYWLQQSGLQDPNQIRQAVRQSEEAMQFQTGPQTMGGITGYRSFDPAMQSVNMMQQAMPEQAARYASLFEGTPTQQVNEMSPEEAASLLGQIAMQAQGGNSDGGNAGSGSYDMGYVPGVAAGFGRMVNQGMPSVFGAVGDLVMSGRGYDYNPLTRDYEQRDYMGGGSAGYETRSGRDNDGGGYDSYSDAGRAASDAGETFF
jgi:hypothetical protein